MRVFRALATSMMLLAPSFALAQGDKEPRRPKLVVGADTNDAHAYYDFAIDILSLDAKKAADALYWATRLDPTWADALFARRVALLLIDPTRFLRYSAGDQRAIDEARTIDSLLFRALTIDPFVSQRLDRKLVDGMLDDMARRLAGGRVNSGDVRFRLDMAAQHWPPSMRARLAYGDGQFDQALILYTQAIEHSQKSVTLRLDRARLLVEMNRLDGAVIDLTGALEELRKSDQKDLIFVYRSKALIEHSLAAVYLRLGKTAAAKDAYSRALEEDLSYYPAHLQLAMMALDAADTTTALAELDLATQLRNNDAAAQYLSGFMLVRAGRPSQGQLHLKRSIELNPVYAAPKFVYARLLESADFQEEAVAAYKAFLGVAARSDPHRSEAETRLAALTTSKPPVTRR